MASYTTYFQQARQFEQQGEWQQAIDCYTRALAIHPDPAEAYYHIGRAESRLGRGEQAIRAFQKAIEIQPDFARAWHDMVVEISNLLFRLNYQELSREAVFERHKTWAARIEAPLAPFITSHAHDKTPNRKLRVGFVSRDFYTHSVSYFLNGLFTAFDRTAFEFFCYSDTAVPDRVTERFKSLVSSFRDTRALSHLMLANVIREDRIHILVDLAGHSGNNRLCAFAMKPAPIQVTYLGYPNTTGFSTMDYRIVDDITDPEGDGDRFASERLFRLPRGFLCYTPFDPPPETDIAPAMQSGPITFGSFNISGKISKKTARLWSAILKAVPASRLFLKCRAYDDPRHKNHILSLFQDHQIPAERILFSGWVRDQADHLRCYNRMDIALDTFPYTGTTTTCEALLMGVPVITLKGESHAARVSTSILTHAGLDDLIAGSPEAYIDKAVALAGNRQRLAHYKTTLRQTFMDSPVMATQLFTRQMETAFRRIWEIWCGPDQTGPEKNVCSPPQRSRP